MNWKALFFCTFSHSYVRSRTGEGAYVLRCTECQTERPFFAEEVVRGPKHCADEVLGKPTGKAKILRAATTRVRSIR
jgi:hypothetical protein